MEDADGNLMDGPQKDDLRSCQPWAVVLQGAEVRCCKNWVEVLLFDSQDAACGAHSSERRRYKPEQSGDAA